MIKTAFGLLTFISFFTYSVSAQTVDISIKLLDSDNQEPLIGATIQIEELKQGTVTDIDGIGNSTSIETTM